MKPDIDAVTALIQEVAATEILPRFEKLAAHEIREKSPGDVVTVADEAAEAWLTPRLTAGSMTRSTGAMPWRSREAAHSWTVNGLLSRPRRSRRAK